MNAAPLLDVRDLRVELPLSRGTVHAVEGVSLTVGPGEAFGLVGESGCGKSMTLRAIMGLLPRPGEIVGGQVLFEGEDLVTASPGRLRQVRGGSIAMIFQEPMTALNPVMRVGDQIAEGPQVHLGLSRTAARERALDLMRRVGIPDPVRRRERVPARALRRPAPAHHDRHRAGVRSQGDPVRRAHDRARRDDPGSDSEAAPEPPARVRRERGLRHPRPGRGRRDVRAGGGHVRRADRRDRDGRRGVPCAAASVHARPAPLGSRLRQRAGLALGDPGSASRPRAAASGLPVPSPVPVRPGGLHLGEFPLRPLSAGRATACIHSEACVADVERRPVVADA